MNLQRFMSLCARSTVRVALLGEPCGGLLSRRASHQLASSSSRCQTQTTHKQTRPDWALIAALHSGVSAPAAPASHRARTTLGAAAPAASPAELEPTCWKCTISNVTGSDAEMLTDTLLSFGSQSVAIVEHCSAGVPEQEIFDDGKSKLWDKCDVIAHFALEHDVDATIAICGEILDMAGLEFTKQTVANEAWVEQIKASYIPLKITKDLYIVPEWSQPEDPAALNIMLQPGVAFGTGEHPTTNLCLQQLHAQRQALAGLSVMDYGTGSGVLAIAALLMGASCAVGTDVDSLAVKAASRNAELNGVQGSFTALLCGPDIDGPEPVEQQLGQAGRQFDLCIANILRGPLVELQPRLSSYVVPGGQLMLSGILVEQAAEIQAAYEGSFEAFQVSSQGSWAMILARRRR